MEKFTIIGLNEFIDNLGEHVQVTALPADIAPGKKQYVVSFAFLVHAFDYDLDELRRHVREAAQRLGHVSQVVAISLETPTEAQSHVKAKN